MSESNGTEEKFSFSADDDNAPRMMTIKIPIARLVEAEADGYARLLGYMKMYSNQMETLFHMSVAEKKKSGLVLPKTGLEVV